MFLIALLLLSADIPAAPKDPRIAVAQAVAAILAAERDEAIAEAQRLQAQARKAAAAAALEAAKRKLPNWREGALLADDFGLSPEPKK